MRNLKLRLALGSALVLPAFIASAAHAQASPAGQGASTATQPDMGAAPDQSDNRDPQDIIVTGTRTGAQLLQRTPAAISVVGPQLMQQQGLATVQDIATYVPNLSFSRNTLTPIIRIRGIGSTNASAGSDPSVTMQVDGVYIARPSGQLTDFFDVERIEVLRGPQGTLYGRNAVGGTINVISRTPSRELTGRVRLTYGNFDTFQAEGYISGPTSDNSAASLAATYRRHDPYFDNIVPGGHGVGSADRLGLRGQFRWDIAPNFHATTRGDYSTADEYFESYDHLIVPLPFAAPLANSQVGSHRDIAINADQTLRSRVGGLSQEFDWEISHRLSLRSLSAWRRTHSRVFNDSDATEFNLLFLRIEEQDEQISQEFTLNYQSDKLRAVAGVYYFGDTDHQVNRSQAPPSVATPAPASAITTGGPDVETDSYAAFAQAEYEFVPNVTLVVGARYTTEHKVMDQVATRTRLNPAQLGQSFPGFPAIFTVDRTDDAFTPRFGLNFQATPDIFFYGSVARGFKSGGFNNASASRLTAGFEPEELWAYEGGVRTQWLNRRVRLNLTGFYYDYTNLQVRQLLGPGNAVISNAASAKIKGLEAEFGLAITPELQLSGNVSILDATYDSFPTASIPGGLTAFVPGQTCVAGICTINASGHRLDDSPKFSGLVALDFTPHIGAYTLNAHVDVAWRSRVYFDPSNVAVASQSGYALVNANLGFGQQTGWRIEAYVRNLANKGYYQTISGNGIVPGAIAGDPRTFGIRVGFDW
jgi:iron complex outermembrane receptor protein